MRVHFLHSVERKLYGIGTMAIVSGVLELIRVSVFFRIAYSNGKFKQLTQASDFESNCERAGGVPRGSCILVDLPEGSIGKQGPSVGMAILTALVSLFTKVRVSQDMDMDMCFFLPFLVWLPIFGYPCYSNGG